VSFKVEISDLARHSEVLLENPEPLAFFGDQLRAPGLVLVVTKFVLGLVVDVVEHGLFRFPGQIHLQRGVELFQLRVRVCKEIEVGERVNAVAGNDALLHPIDHVLQGLLTRVPVDELPSGSVRTQFVAAHIEERTPDVDHTRRSLDGIPQHQHQLRVGIGIEQRGQERQMRRSLEQPVMRASRREDSANSRPFSPEVIYPRRSIQAGGGSWAGRGGPYHNEALLLRGIGIRLNGQEKTNAEEYCISEGWIRVAAGKAVDRKGKPLTLKLKGTVEVWILDDTDDAATP